MGEKEIIPPSGGPSDEGPPDTRSIPSDPNIRQSDLASAQRELDARLIDAARQQIDAAATTLPLPTQIGPYRLLETLGEGGMGTVYLAEQVQPVRRRVALKLVKLGMDTREVVARFESERQALAMMNHPNVATVYDAGATDQGRPYFVMEYVAGIPITEHCDRHKLRIDERIDLFVQVCDAVQHAHQKGIIHRDLKPSNILVAFQDGKAVPKVIDFGVAKALFQRLTDKTVFTELGRLIGTPEYMSPEQAERTSQDIDTRSDIYSLGVLLYELLTGQLPFDPKSFRRAALEEIARILREEEPAKPSTKLSTLMTAMSRDSSSLVARNRQLAVRALARKVRGDLDWVTMKCLEKDRSRRYASAAELAADLRRHIKNEPVMAGPPDALYRFNKFLRRRRAELVKAAVVVSLIALAGTTVFFATRESWSQRDALRLRAPHLLTEAKRLSLRDPQTALKKLEQAVAADPDLVEAQLQRALLLKRVRRNAEAIAVLERLIQNHSDRGEARVILAELLQVSDPSRAAQYRREAEVSLPLEQDLYYQAMALDENHSQQAIELLNRSLDAYPWNFEAVWERGARYFLIKNYKAMLADAELLVKVGRDLGQSWELKGVALQELGRLEDSVTCYSEAIARNPDHWLGYFNRANAYFTQKQFKRALQDSSRAALLAPEEAEAHELHSRILAWLKRWEAAMEAVNRAIELDPELIDAYAHRGELFRRKQEYAEAIEDFSKAIGRLADDAQRAELLDVRGTAYLGLRKWDRAQADFDKAIELLPEYDYPNHRENLGKLYLLIGDYRKALELHQQLVDHAPDDSYGLLGRGIAFWFSGDTVRAIEDFKQSVQRNPTSFGVVYLWVWEVEMQRGNQNAAVAALAEAEKVIKDPWQRRLWALIQGEGPPAQILEAAQDKSRQCDAFYYLGARALVLGQNEEAANRFRQCTQLGLVDVYEHILAQCHLRALGK